ncbi:MAG TPA: hypothetical protein VFA38_01035 [Nitrospirales bacterium]|nr:hypothetical protein [Nitrospirales bacterium]
MAASLLALAPFSVALEIHHVFAAADTDGHQHSDSDLCQWVQAHTGSSLVAALPVPAGHGPIRSHDQPAPRDLTASRALPVSPPRGPPYA